MSSPIASPSQTFFQKLQIALHKRLSHRTRVQILAEIFAQQIRHIFPEKTVLKCLDVGCGDMVISEGIQSQLTDSQWTCIDIYPLPEQLKNDAKWQKYQSFDGTAIPFEDNHFDVLILADVLHHVPQEKLFPLLKECKRVAKYIFIKDHFQYGAYSNQMLTLMDKFGNASYGVAVPALYFSEKSFAALEEKLEVTNVSEIKNIQLYQHLPLIRSFLRSKWQFLAVWRTK